MYQLLLNKYVLYAGAVLIILAALAFGEYKVYSFGYNKAAVEVNASWTKKMNQELARQAEIQDKIVNEQKQTIAELQAVEDDLAKKLKENEIEAAKDSNSGNTALDNDAVMRINRIR